jgi:NADH:ubiquinone oxidoreductase subunit E
VCEQAPALMIDDDLHTHVDSAGLDQILARYP